MNIRKSLKICGIINLIFATLGLFYLEDAPKIIIPIFLVLLGIYFYNLSEASDYKLKKNKTLLIVIAVISLFLNPITSIILLVNVDRIKIECNSDIRGPDEKEIVDPEAKKLDIVLKLGVLMVILAGFIFATTSWDIIPDFVKSISLLVLGLIFMALSYLADKKLKLESSQKMYYLLGMIFIWLSYYSVGFYGLLNDLLGIGEESTNLFLASTSLLATLQMFIASKTFKNELFKIFIFLGLFISIILILTYFDLDMGLILLIINSLLFIVHLLSNKYKYELLSIFTLISIYIATIITMLCFEEMMFLTNLLNLILLVSEIIIINKSNSKPVQVTNALLIPIVLMTALGSSSIDNELKSVLLVSLTSLIYVLLAMTKYLEKHSLFSKIFIPLANLLTIAFLFDVINYSGTYFSGLILSLIVLVINILILLSKNDVIKLEKYLTPIKMIPLIGIIGTNILNLTDYQIFTIIFLSYGILMNFLKDKKIFNFMFIVEVLLILYLLIEEYYATEIFSLLATLFGVIALYALIEDQKDNKFIQKSKIFYFVLMLLSINTLLSSNLFSLNNIFMYLIIIVLYIIIILLFRNDKVKYTITSYALILPINSLMDLNYLDNDLLTIIRAMLVIYLSFITCHNLIKDKEFKIGLLAVLNGVVLASIVFNGSLIVSLFIGIMALLYILLGLLTDEYKNFFIIGIIFTVINIIYQLRNLWVMVPLWLYLLIIGSILIGLVTYKEIKRK